ncbi:T-cell immunomodulatory protein isoform X4 [Zootermopsis nevadensis]|uniref:T-cell immunomodulatory protein isoform X4 n=1 Tax=Zootermopsis nevadensis TaxID=136037 RepID=UPI000B8E2533|nr:T-cell immunomodulatory protein isoform X4 [Zootermopsis nevadensis]
MKQMWKIVFGDKKTKSSDTRNPQADAGKRSKEIRKRGTRLSFFKGILKDAALCLWVSVLLSIVPLAAGGNITSSVFGSATDVMPAAFGDFNSDELTDLFVVYGKPNTLEVMLARVQEPLFQSGQSLSCLFSKMHITSIVPGNFDGDARLDVLVTALETDVHNSLTQIFILWGGLNYLICSNETVIYRMRNQPVVLDYNHDMIVDLFGEDVDGNRMFLVFNENRTVSPQVVPMIEPEILKVEPLRVPHSHSFLDLNGDFTADLLLSTKVGFELWLGNKNGKLTFDRIIQPPVGLTTEQMGQSLFLDLELTGEMYHLLPVCFDGFKDCVPCRNSTLFAYVKEKWHNLNPVLKDGANQVWGFYRCSSRPYTDAVTLRGGDFNMDGYPDILATLSVKNSHSKVFLLENVENLSGSLGRTYAIRGDPLVPMNNETTMAAFYDLYQDGILDVILYGQDKVQAFRNTLDYDANFVKVMVLTGTDRGGNLPGPSISYRTTTQEGDPRAAVTAQLPQSAHFSLGLPYTIFGLGRTPNFVDTLTVGIAGRSKAWTQIIPNSQMVVIPSPPDQTSKWRAQLFITPSSTILLSVVALSGTCVIITLIIAALYLKERNEDRLEKLQEAHRFHFDAM